MPNDLSNRFDRWRSDPVAFIREVLRDPETGKPFQLYDAQERFLRKALTLKPDGRMPFPELIYGAIKKSGKTATAAMIVIYVIVVLGGPYAEAYVIANDLEQAQGRVFQAIARIIEASSLLRDSATITASRVVFPSTGSSITAIASDYAGAAGANPTIVCFDELWAYTSERSQRLFDEMVPVPTRKISVRLTTTYAGYTGESVLLERMYKSGLEGEQIAPCLYQQQGLLMFWSHEPIAPWQTSAWIEEMRLALRPNAFLRLIRNEWVTSESTFIDMDWYERCVDHDLSPELADTQLSVWVGVDASTKRDSTAIAVATFDPKIKKVRLVWHKTWQPSVEDPLDFSETIERTLLDLRRRFYIREVRYDPFQMQATAQRLTAMAVPMIEFAQTSGNLTEASTNLYELFKGKNLILYPDADLRLAVSRSVAVESSRGWKISKEKASHKIDIVVALAQACLGAVAQQAAISTNWTYQEMQSMYDTQYRGGQRSAIIQPRAGMGRQQIIDAEDDARNDAARLLRRFSTNKRFLPRDEFFRVIGW